MNNPKTELQLKKVPFGVRIIAICFFVISIISFVSLLLMVYLILGFLIWSNGTYFLKLEWLMTIIFSVFAAIFALVGVGLLKLKKLARVVCILFFMIFFVILVILTIPIIANITIKKFDYSSKSVSIVLILSTFFILYYLIFSRKVKEAFY